MNGIKEMLKDYIDLIPNEDTVFISQIYTLLKRHRERNIRRTEQNGE